MGKGKPTYMIGPKGDVVTTKTIAAARYLIPSGYRPLFPSGWAALRKRGEIPANESYLSKEKAS